MSLPTIDPLPPAPQREDAPEVFVERADAMMAAFPGMVLQINEFIAQLMVGVSGIDYNGTSTTSLTIGTGSKVLTTQTGKNFQIGQPVRIAYTTTPSNYMDGQVTAYNSGTGALTVLVGGTPGGSGTYAAWTISLLPSSGSVATISGAETLTNKTLTTPILSAVASGTTAGALGYDSGDLSFGDGSVQRIVVSTDKAQTLTNKTIDTAAGSGNILKINGNSLAAAAGSATITFFNSSDTVVGRNTTDTLTNKSLTTPVLTGSASGTTAGRLGYSGGVFTYGNGSNQRTVADTASTQTLTGKTLTSPVLTTPTIDSAPFPTVDGTAPLYLVRAWVNFNGSGVVAINASGNVSSITDNGVGDYTINFTTAMPDANYAWSGGGTDTDSGGDAQLGQPAGATKTASAFRFKVIDNGSPPSGIDSVNTSIMFVR